MDKQTVYKITSEGRIPMKLPRTIDYYFFPMIVLLLGCIVVVQSGILSLNANLVAIVVVSILFSLSLTIFILQYYELKLRVIDTDNNGNENFKLLKTFFENSGFQLDVTNKHSFIARQQYRTCIFYFYLIGNKVFYTYAFDIRYDYSWYRDHQPFRYVFFNPFIRKTWRKRLKDILLKNK